VLEIFSPVRKRVASGSYTGYGKRLPSDRPPVLTPKELALSGADGAGNGQALGSDGSPSIGTSPISGPPPIGGPPPLGPLGGSSMSAREPDEDPPGGAH
jgi:hypothetical protein